jgi:2-keto-myo-inositol isomerase
MKLPLIMHINCCEQGQTIDDACRKCAELGFDGIEFRRKRSRVAESAEEYLDSIARSVEKHKVKIVLFGSPGLQKLDGTEAERAQEMEEMIKFYELASSRFQLSICNTFAGPLLNPAKGVSYFECTKHGSFIVRKEQWEYAVNGFKALGELAQKLGFRFAFETHMNYLHDTIESACRLVRDIDSPAVGINLDYGNLVYFQDVPPLKDTIGMAGEKLFYVHLKNSIGLPGGGRIGAGLGEGDINNREFLKILKETGYDGPLCVEVPRSGDREEFAENDLRYLRKLIEAIW